MFSNKITYNKQPDWHKQLPHIRTSYDKLEKEMNEPLKDYDSIKQLIETKNNSIANVNNKPSKSAPSTGSHKKNNKNKKKF